jgi:hypothetical protein
MANFNLVVPRGVGSLIAAAYAHLVSQAREQGLEETRGYHHNLDSLEKIQAMEEFRFFDAYPEPGRQRSELKFSLWETARTPEIIIESLAVERVLNFQESERHEGGGDSRRRETTYSGIVLLRSLSHGPFDSGWTTRLKVRVTTYHASNNNMYSSERVVEQLTAADNEAVEQEIARNPLGLSEAELILADR